MADRLRDFTNSPLGKQLGPRLGLPRPAVLRRYSPGDPVLDGPALLAVAGASAPDDTVGTALRSAGVPVVGIDDASTRLSAIVVDATGLERVEDLAGIRSVLSGSLRRLRPSGRVILLARPVGESDSPELAATRQAVDGLTRSIAKEGRNGVTANLILVGTDSAAVALESALRFFLSGRSAYVDGQVVRLGAVHPVAPADWDHPLAGKVALVTGAARGIGAAIAETLARDGAHVVCADLPAAGDALMAVANRVGGTTLQLDISAGSAPVDVSTYLLERHGGIDVVVHNAGITRDKLLANMKPEVWSSVLDVNLAAQLRINAALVSQNVLRADGRIVSLSSTSGIAGNRGQTNYAASKAGIIGMVRATAPSLAGLPATINAVAPGFIETAMTARMPFATREVARRLNSLLQAGLPVDVAEAIAWLCSPGAGAVSGQVLRVCGQNLVGA